MPSQTCNPCAKDFLSPVCPEHTAGPQPRWGCVHGRSVPKVARSSQPWAEGHNPFGIEQPGRFSKTEMRPSDFGIEFALAIPRPEHTLPVQHQSKSHYETGVVG